MFSNASTVMNIWQTSFQADDFSQREMRHSSMTMSRLTMPAPNERVNRFIPESMCIELLPLVLLTTCSVVFSQ